MWHLLKSYIKFLYNSTNQHGVHSPFIYNLITKCFYDKSKQEDYTILKRYRAKLYNNNETISITDFGAGSRVFKSNERIISKIAKTAGATPKRTKLLYRVTKYLNISSALELGTSLGIATTALSLANSKGKVTTIEGCPETAKIAQQYFTDFNLNNVKLYNTSFEKAFTELNNQKFDLVYIDGNHQKEATLKYFKSLIENTHNDTVFIFDDIHWSKAMTEAWELIKKHHKVTVTIDTFFWGFVFFRKEQEKQHFTIRM